MADFCRACSIEVWGTDFRDLAGLTIPENAANGRYALVLCEGCGPIQVDPDGNRITDANAEPDVSADELRRMDEAHAAEERAWAEARTSGLDFIPGCSCCGSNTPELIGRCPCRGIDLRVLEHQS